MCKGELLPLHTRSGQSLETEFRRELHQARIACEGCDPTYSTAVDVPFGKPKLSCIEHVEHLPANLQATTLTEVVERAGQGQVKVSKTWTSKSVAPTGTQPGLHRTRRRIQRRRGRICRRIKPPIYGAFIP